MFLEKEDGQQGRGWRGQEGHGGGGGVGRGNLVQKLNLGHKTAEQNIWAVPDITGVGQSNSLMSGTPPREFISLFFCLPSHHKEPKGGEEETRKGRKAGRRCGWVGWGTCRLHRTQNSVWTRDACGDQGVTRRHTCVQGSFCFQRDSWRPLQSPWSSAEAQWLWWQTATLRISY